jgi:hypothetical protein
VGGLAVCVAGISITPISNIPLFAGFAIRAIYIRHEDAWCFNEMEKKLIFFENPASGY